MPDQNRRRGGRIRTADRNTHDTLNLLGDNVDVDDEHQTLVRNTEKLEINVKLQNEYRNRLAHIYKFFEEKYPEYYEVGVRVLTPEEKVSIDQHWNKNDRDLIYCGLNVKFIKAFLAHAKKKKNGKICSNSNIRKYKDAILWGSSQAKSPLPSSFYDEIDRFLKSFKKETKAAAKDGLLDEREADPISWTLFKLILKWAIEAGSIIIWTFSLLQWNCMARSKNIGDLAYHNFTVGDDYIKIRYDKTKADQDGERIKDKHMYANPYNPLVCPFLALGIWFALDAKRLSGTTKLFSVENVKEEAPGNRYTSALSQLFKDNIKAVSNFIRRDHANAHGVRKGSASFACSGTTCPPSVASIANRGDWSMGAVLDVYWHFAEPGDHFLGRILAGLDPNKSEFATLPPHFIMEGNLMDDEDVKEAMHMMYGPILEKYQDNPELDPTGLLLMILASVVHHSPWVVDIVMQKSGHPFSLVPLTNSPELLKRLQSKVSLKVGGQVSRVTGIPPHIQNAVLCSKILKLCGETLAEVKHLTNNIKDAVAEAYEKKAEENGHLTGEKLKGMFNEYHEQVLKAIDERIKDISIAPQVEAASEEVSTNIFADSILEEPKENTHQEIQYRLYTYKGKMWQVPKNFRFPANAKLLTGWQLWVGGQPGYKMNKEDKPGEVQLAPVRPFRLLSRKFLPKEARQVYSLSWVPIFELMQSAPGIDFKLDAQESFKIGFEYLKNRVEYIFNSPRMKPDTWRVAYWSVKVQRSSIMKFGTDADKSRLPPASRRNKTRKQCDRTNNEGVQVKRRRIKKNPQPVIITQEEVLPPQPQEVLPPQPQEAQPLIAPVTTPIVPLEPQEAQEPQVVLPVEPQEQQQSTTQRRAPNHDLMMRRQSNRIKTKKKQSSTPSNDFANAFNDIPVLFVRRARESSAPLPPPPPPPPRRCIIPPPRRCIIPGRCAGCKKPVSNIHTCDVCGHNMHVFCGLPIGEEGYGQKIRCVECQQALGD